MQYVIAPSNLDIQHHGILGQKWGKQNGPPYPLGASDHSAAEKKAGYRKSLQKGKYKEYNKRIPISNMSVRYTSKEANDALRENYKIARKNAKEAFKDIRRTAKLANKYDKKMAEGKEDKITLKEIVGKEVAEASLNKYYESLSPGGGEKSIDKLLQRSANMSAITAHAILGLPASIPVSINNSRALEYIKKSKKTSGINAYKNGDRSDTTLKRMDMGDLGGLILDESRNPVGKNHKKVISDYEKASKKVTNKDDRFDLEREYMNKDASAILKDLGFKDTLENRQKIRENWPNSLYD